MITNNKKIIFTVALTACFLQVESSQASCSNNSNITSALVRNNPTEDTTNCGTITIDNPNSENSVAVKHDDATGSGLYNVSNNSALTITNSNLDSIGIFTNKAQNLINTGSINTSSLTNTNGISATFIYNELNNSGDITIDSSLTGMGIKTWESNNVINNGSIDITSNSKGYGINIGKSSGYLDNTGDITINATTDATGVLTWSTGAISNSGSLNIISNNEAYGLNTSEASGDIDNSGKITISSDSNATGISTWKTGSVTNNNTISITSSNNGNGINIGKSSGYVNNSGDITINDATNAIGISTWSTGAITNSGALNITNTGQGLGINISEASGDIDNSGTITINSDLSATGINTWKTGAVTNNNTINLASMGDAMALKVNNATGSFINSGDINITSGTSNYGMYTTVVDNFINTGGVNISSSANSWGIYSEATKYQFTNSADFIINSDGNSHGIDASAVTDFSNMGNLSVTGLNNAYGIILNDVRNEAKNYGEITVSGNNSAYGLVVSQSSKVENFGKISATSSSGESYGALFDNNSSVDFSTTKEVLGSTYNIAAKNNTNLNISNYAITFDGSQSQIDADHKGKIGYDNTSNVSFNNAKLTIYTGNNFKKGQGYKIPTLLRNINTGELNGYSDQFTSANIGVGNPDYTVRLINKNGSGNQQIIIGLEPTDAVSKASNEVNNVISKITSRSIKNDMKSVIFKDTTASNLIGDIDTGKLPDNNTSFTVTQNGINYNDPLANFKTTNNASNVQKINNQYVFVTPYYSKTTDDSSPVGYDAYVSGLTTGINFMPHKNTLVGFHIGYSNSNIEFTGQGYDLRTKDANNYIAGIQAAKLFDKKYMLSGTSSLTISKNRYQDKSSTNKEKADYASRGLSSDIEVGVINKVQDITFIPKLGLNHNWFSSNAYTTDNSSNADTRYSKISDHSVTATIGAEAHTTIKLNDWTLMPNIHASIDRLLTNNKIRSEVVAGNASAIVESKANKMSYNLGGSMAFEKEENTFTLGYDALLENNITSQKLFIEYKYNF